jgi:phage baseplate assembly protein W
MAQQYTYTDIDLELEKKRDGDIQEFTSVDAVKSSITNIVQTFRGSRRMIPEFAANL